MITFLRTVPAISNRSPPPSPPNNVVYLWGKFRMLILKEVLPEYTYLHIPRIVITSSTPS